MWHTATVTFKVSDTVAHQDSSGLLLLLASQNCQILQAKKWLCLFSPNSESHPIPGSQTFQLWHGSATLSHTRLLCKGTGLFLEGNQPLTPLPGVWPNCAGSIMHEAENLWISGRASSRHRETRHRLVTATACLCCCLILYLKLRSWRVQRGQSEVRLCGRAGEIPPDVA